MRTYIGTTDSSTGEIAVTISEQGENLSFTTIGHLLDRLDDIAAARRLDPQFLDPVRTTLLIEQEHATLRRLKAAEITSRPLDHETIHSPDGFAWGYQGSGPADLAHAILQRELGDRVPPDVYLAFRDQVVANLPNGAFELPASDVWDWIRHNRTLVESHLFGIEPETPAETHHLERSAPSR